jgi:erythromycin esterase-like protein
MAKRRALRRFPAWMWRNTAVFQFVDWLQKHNSELNPQARTAFYGLDIYSLHSSMKAVINYLKEVDPKLARHAKDRYGCIEPYAESPQRYGYKALEKGYGPCEKSVLAVLDKLLQKRLEYEERQPDGDAFLDAESNARIVTDSEEYYRAMYRTNDDSWNLRDTHMVNTLERVMKKRGPDSKIVVWAHNR